MIPLRDANPTLRTPVVTIALIAACALVFVLELAILADGGEAALQAWFETFGFVPAAALAALGAGDPLAPLVAATTSTFLHGGWLHLVGNMLYLWIFGNNVEDRLGRVRFLLFYLAGGLAGAAAQAAIDPASEVPLVGASGAISAALGAYLVLFPRARVQSLVFLGCFYQLVAVPAVLVLGFWFVLQVVDGVGALGPGAAVVGIAFFAHIGGFVAGVVAALPFRRPAAQVG